MNIVPTARSTFHSQNFRDTHSEQKAEDSTLQPHLTLLDVHALSSGLLIACISWPNVGLCPLGYFLYAAALATSYLSYMWSRLTCKPPLKALRIYVRHFYLNFFCIIANHCLLQQGLSYTSTYILEKIKKTKLHKKDDNHHGKFLGTTSIYILGSHASLALTLVGLRPSLKREKKVSATTQLFFLTAYTYFLILIDSIWMKPVVSVGSKPPSSSMDDWCSSYRP